MIKRSISCLLIVLIAGCGILCRKNTEGKIMDKTDLILQTKKKTFALNEDILIQVTISNLSPDTIFINNRFLIGYEEETERELYFSIFDSKGKRYDTIDKHTAEILPMAVKLENMEELAPGDKIQKTIKLNSVYEIKDSGKYKIVGFYESKVSSFGKKKDKTMQSDTLDIEILN